MKKINPILYILIFTLNNFSCEQEDISSIESNTAVVAAYLFDGQSVDSIRITQSIGYNQSDTALTTLDDLEVAIIDGDRRYLLENIGDGYYKNDALIIQTETTYELDFIHNGEVVSAETFIPKKKEAILSSTSISLAKIEGFPTGGFGAIPDPIEVTWDNNEGDFYYVKVTNLEEDPEYVNELLLQFGGIPRGIQFNSDPEVTDFHVIQPNRDLTQYGRYEIIVFRVQPEYASLFNLGNNSSQTITEPPSNVTNGLGLFTGVSSDTLY
ncbi:MAG: DUF4249 family protein, partial [Bacteroidota bacterium]